MHPILRLVALTACAVTPLACHNQSTDDDRGQAMHGKNPDSVAVPPQPVVVTSAGPASSVPAVSLARMVPPGPPNHDGPAVLHVEVGNMSLEGRTVTAQNTGNVGVVQGRAVVYAYDGNHNQIARVEVPLFSADAGAPVLPPRDAVRTLLPIAPAIARDPKTWFIPVLVHVDFADGAKWDAPQDRAPANRPFTESERPSSTN